MPRKAAGRVAAELPWLCPNTDSLIGLAEAPRTAPALAASDPAFRAFLLRFDDRRAGPGPVSSERLLSPLLPAAAAAYLTHAPGAWVDPASEAAGHLYLLSTTAADLAARLAAAVGVCPDAAAAAAHLAPLGWYAVTAVDPAAAAYCLTDPGLPADPARVQSARWGLDQDAVARRLAVRWRLPGWVGGLVGSLSLPLRAVRAAADPGVFAVVQLAVHEAERRTVGLGLTRSADRRECLEQLGLDEPACAAAFEAEGPAPDPPRATEHPQDPRRLPLLRNLLRVAADARRRDGAAVVARLEDRADELHRALDEAARLAADRARDAKLAGLAELAAGAGHEINNPLAVITMSAQRLLRTEPDPAREGPLRAIVRNAQRISGILRDLMHFARPAAATPDALPAWEVLAAVRDELAGYAADRGVRVDAALPPPEVWVRADPGQLRHAVTAVARNGVEAAGVGGWVLLDCEPAADAVRFVVADSGPGLTGKAVDHAFDPFYSGRDAGRGRGLGLSTAWRFARLNGGDVRFDPAPGRPSRFVVTAPRAAARPERRSA